LAHTCILSSTQELQSNVWGEKGKAGERAGDRRWESKECGHEKLAATPTKLTLQMHSGAAS